MMELLHTQLSNPWTCASYEFTQSIGVSLYYLMSIYESKTRMELLFQMVFTECY